MIKRVISQLIKPDNRVKAKDWKDEALIDFFGLKETPIITARDLMYEEDKFKKWIEFQEWKDRRTAYEEFTGQKWRR